METSTSKNVAAIIKQHCPKSAQYDRSYWVRNQLLRRLSVADTHGDASLSPICHTVRLQKQLVPSFHLFCNPFKGVQMSNGISKCTITAVLLWVSHSIRVYSSCWEQFTFSAVRSNTERFSEAFIELERCVRSVQGLHGNFSAPHPVPETFSNRTTGLVCLGVRLSNLALHSVQDENNKKKKDTNYGSLNCFYPFA